MAQTKTKPAKRSSSGKSTNGSKSASRSTKARSAGSSSTKSRNGSSSATKRKSTSTKAKSRPKAKSQSKSKSRSGSAGSSSRSKSSATKRAGGSRGKSGQAKKSGQSKSGAGRSTLDSVKGPATVAGAALLAVAGGVAASRNGSKGGLLRGGSRKLGLPSAKSGLKSLKKIDLPKVDLPKVDLSKIDLPKPDEAIDWVEEKAKDVGDAGYRVAELSSQARSVRKAVSGKD
jgi:hypothetical protein